MSESYARLLDPDDRPGLRDVLAVPGHWSVRRTAAEAGRLMEEAGARVLQLVVDDRPLGVITEATLIPVLLDRDGGTRDGTGLVAGGSLRDRSAVAAADVVRPYRCAVCGAGGWSVAGPPGCPNGPHGSMTPAGI